MEILRYVKTEVDLTNSKGRILIGDKIQTELCTATCVDITEKGALFFMDQYTEGFDMAGDENPYKVRYKNSLVRKYLQGKEALEEFPDEVVAAMVPFENGDLLRIPTVEEMFGTPDNISYNDGMSCLVTHNMMVASISDKEFCEPAFGEQLPMLEDRNMRVCLFQDVDEIYNLGWGWLQNKLPGQSEYFAVVDSDGDLTAADAKSYGYIRKVFMIGNGGK